MDRHVDSTPEKTDPWLEIGAVTRPHGVRGALRVRLHDPTSAAAESVPVSQWRLLAADAAPIDGLQVEGRQGEFLLLRAPRISTREAAESLRGAALQVPRDAIDLDEDEYLFADLLGCAVVEGSRSFGSVRDVFSAGASPILVVVDDEGKERLIPLVEDWVSEIDVEARRVELRDGDTWDLE